MCRRRIVISCLVVVVLCSVWLSNPVVGGNREIGGYVAQAEDRFVRNVWNFVKSFQSWQSIGGHSWKHDQYYWMEPWVFESAHGSYVDAQDMAYVACHGNYWVMACHDGIADVDLRDCPPYGDFAQNNHDLEFLVIESCSTITAYPDAGFSWNDWRNTSSGGIFNGLHQAMGFHTLSYSDNGIPEYFAVRCLANDIVWNAWFSAVQEERSNPTFSPVQPEPGVSYPGWASGIMAQKCRYDRLGSYVSDPVAADLLYSVWEE